MEQELQYYKDISFELESILDLAFDQITVSDGKGVFTRVSKRCTEIFGITMDEIIGKSAYELEEKGVFNHSATVEVVETKKEVTLLQETLNGRKLLVTGRPILDASGNIKSVVNVSKDITEIVSLREELLKRDLLLAEMQKQLTSKNTPQGANIFYGASETTMRVKKLMEHVAPLNVTVLLQGETGVGKSLFAKLIHNWGPNKEEPFIQINCGAIPEELMESELFGYVSGAFTGAVKGGKDGLLTTAGKGTIFLDEISEIPLHLQVKLLQVLQERVFFKVGDTKPTSFKARVIVASNRNLKQLVAEEKFREDLYYRISVVPILLPPLRERKEDLEMFIHFFLKNMNVRYGFMKKISKEAIRALIAYDWPGNVRELENTIERLVVITMGDTIERQDVCNVLDGEPDETLEDVVPARPLEEALRNLEVKMLLQAKEDCKTTREIAARLGIDQSTVVKKMKKYGL